jgi:hypothetical protein
MDYPCTFGQRAGQEAGAHRTAIIDSFTFSAVLWGWDSWPTQRLTGLDTALLG